MKANGWANIRLGLNVYIAIMLTGLAVLVVHDLGTNNTQNHTLALQAKEIAESNRKSGIAGCRRGKKALRKINVVAGALSTLLQKSVEESEAKGHHLTPQQQAFLEHEYELLAPLGIPKSCAARYPKPPGAE